MSRVIKVVLGTVAACKGDELSTSRANGTRLPSIELGRGRIDYTVVKGASRRYTYFRFRPDLTLEVVLPRGRSVDVEEEIEEKSEWILEQYDRLTRGERVLDGDSVMFDGCRLRVDF